MSQLQLQWKNHKCAEQKTTSLTEIVETTEDIQEVTMERETKHLSSSRFSLKRGQSSRDQLNDSGKYSLNAGDSQDK